jgi:carboxypeptidase T
VLTNQAITGTKPIFFLMAAIHAREYTTAESAMRFAEQLVRGYGRDPDATWLLDYTEIHVVPQANPDGRKQAENRRIVAEERQQHALHISTPIPLWRRSQPQQQLQVGAV